MSLLQSNWSVKTFQTRHCCSEKPWSLDLFCFVRLVCALKRRSPLWRVSLSPRWKWLLFLTNGICMASQYCFASWILQWRVVHMRIAPWSVLKIWDNKVSERWCVSLAPIVRSPNCPHAGRRFLIRHQQPQHQAHSRRSPISTESHHEIGLQTGKCFIFSLQLTLIRRIPGPSGHIALFTHPCSFFIHEKQWHVCLEWLPAWNFLKVVSRNLTTWQTSDVIKWRINS